MTQILECINCGESINLEGKIPDNVALIHVDCVAKLKRNIRRQISGSKSSKSNNKSTTKRGQKTIGKKMSSGMSKKLREMK